MRNLSKTDHQHQIIHKLTTFTDKMIGSSEKGKIGDILILNKNPLENIENTSSIIYVIKNGETMKPRDLAD